MKLALPTAITVTALAATLTACGGGSSPSATASATASLPAVQPCDRISAGPVAKVLGSGLKVNTGTSSAPRCGLLPTKNGRPVFTMSYQWWFKGGLDAAWKTMKMPAGDASDVRVPGADAAKIVVQSTKKQYFISGFVETGDLIQLVNGEALAPYDAGRMRAATMVILTQLAKGAPTTAG